jgi:predicted nucleotidyltransferase
MDFKLAMKNILSAFEREAIDYALIGGFALGLWGVTRATVDIDFLVLLESIERAHGVMTRLGYELRYKSDNVSQYISPVKLFGEIDFLHAFRDISKSMLQRADRKPIFDGAMQVKVLRPDDLIGLKVQAIANDPERRNNDLADIEALMHLHGKALDWALVKSYFKLFDFDALYIDLRSRYGENRK